MVLPTLVSGGWAQPPFKHFTTQSSKQLLLPPVGNDPMNLWVPLHVYKHVSRLTCLVKSAVTLPPICLIIVLRDS